MTPIRPTTATPPAASRHHGLLMLPAMAALLLAGCIRPPPDAAQHAAAGRVTAGMRCSSQVLSRLYFGLDSPQGPITQAAWQRFVDDEIGPRLPGGFTLLDAQGQWRDEGGVVRREASRVLEVVADEDASVQQALAQIVGRYRLQFQQQAVLLTQHGAQACL